MSDHTSVPSSSRDELNSESEVLGEARDAAMMRAVMRVQETRGLTSSLTMLT